MNYQTPEENIGQQGYKPEKMSDREKKLQEWYQELRNAAKDDQKNERVCSHTLYSPRIREDQIHRLYLLKEKTDIPITNLVRIALAFFLKRQE